MTEENLPDWLQNANVRELREHLTLGQCRLLQAAVSGHKVEFDLEETKWESLKNNLRLWKIINQQTNAKELIFDGFHLFKTRAELIQNYQRGFNPDPHTPQAVGSVLSRAISAVTQAWDYQRLPKTKDIDDALITGNQSGQSTPREPSFMEVLSSKDANLANNLRALAICHGWSHPGVQLVGETFAALVGDFRQPELQIQTKVMFATNSLVHPRGVIAKLTLERLPNGCGMLLPDAFYGGYLWMPGGSFENGLQNARLAALKYLAQQSWHVSEPSTYDWRWRLDLWPATEAFQVKECFLPLSGRSAEVAFACAMIAAARGNPDNFGGVNPFDRNFAVTASLPAELPSNIKRWQLADDASLPLEKVASVKSKTLVFENVALGDLEKERLAAVVVAENQQPGTLPDDPRFQFPRASNLAKAYELLVRFPRITRGVNQWIARHCTENLDKLCTPYIAPDVANLTIWRAHRETNTESRDKSDMPPTIALLTPSELNRLNTGNLHQHGSPGKPSEAKSTRLRGNRIFIEADSGQGKSMFLLCCQKTIAESPDAALLPLRFGKTLPSDGALSQLKWDALSVETLLSETAVYYHLDAFAKQQRDERLLEPSEQDKRDWMKWMLAQGRVVFLLDALDQTRTESIYQLGPSLSVELFKNCPVILTGRPEAKFSRQESLAKNEWEYLRLVPFDRVRWNRYLGTRNIEKTIDEAILRVPLLLHMLKQILADLEKSGGVKLLSRQGLYEKSIHYLYEKGRKPSQGLQGPGLENETAVKNKLGEIAWWMVWEQGFENDLRESAFERLEYHLGGDLIHKLDALDITTASQLIEPGRDRTGLSFRHRSFLEYFVAWHITRTEEIGVGLRKTVLAAVNDAELRQLLANIHRIPLDELGRALDDRVFWSPDDWENTLRFVLSLGTESRRDWTALQLIELGNPWAVYQSVIEDKLKLSRNMENLVRWLVHRDGNYYYDYSQALEKKVVQPVTVDKARQALESSGLSVEALLSRSTRDASWLSPLRELGCDLNRYYRGIGQESSLLDQMRRLSGGDRGSTWNFLDSFVEVSGGTFDICQRDYATEDQDSTRRSIQPQHVTIPDFALSDFPVTNELFELFCPTYRRWRSPYSLEADQPAIFVSWYMATEFCAWLSALTGQTYRLPTEWEWEWACRWLCGSEDEQRHETYWWGKAMRDDLCWYKESSTSSGTRGRSQAIAAFARVKAADRHPSWRSPQAPGLLDMLGNVWEWCENSYDEEGSYRVNRGGGWFHGAWYCRSADRVGNSPDHRFNFLGFRVSLVPSSQARG